MKTKGRSKSTVGVSHINFRIKNVHGVRHEESKTSYGWERGVTEKKSESVDIDIKIKQFQDW